ncbi:hypothetical protein V5O48_007894 [Marasmius crinis-equi]|uniref:Uncharacterized protein n=1 Tax=Marasmius crinis-equi TaxID=585013 RepID=A0ABR3FFI2_9AGAR
MSLNNSFFAPNSSGSLLPGGGPTQNSTSNKVDIPASLLWRYNQYLRQVFHQGQCSCCETFKEHCMAAILKYTALYDDGIQERDRSITATQTLTNSSLQAQLDNTRRQLRSVERSYDRLNDVHKDLLATHEVTESEPEQAHEKLRLLEEADAERKGKRCRIEYDAPANSGSNPEDMDVDDGALVVAPAVNNSAILPSTAYGRDNAPWEDGLYRTNQQFEAARRNYEAGLPVPKTGENGRPLPRKWAIPTTAKEVEDLIARLKRSESSPHPNIRLFEFLRNLYSEAQRTSREQRNEAQSAILLQYYRPDFVGKKGKNPPGSESTQNVASGVDPAPTISPSTSASADSQAANKPVRPAKHADLTAYVTWLRQEGPTSTSLPFGIRFVEDALRARSARGYRFYMLRSPPSRHVLTPDLYSDYVRDYPLPEPGNHGPTIYPGDFANINTTVLAEFFRQDSVTIADIEDAAYWAACWLADATFKDVESDIALTGLRH